jgi:endogenous inhibitor of DNA gyrase (YacG/DUF329 family)
MKIIVKCPNCGRDVITGETSSPAPKTVFNQKKECPGCKKGLVITVDIEAKIDGPKKE